MQTASVDFRRHDDGCSVRVDGVVSAHLVADLRRLSGSARQTRLDLRGAWVSTEGVDALRSWHRSAGGRLELVLPMAMTTAPADTGTATDLAQAGAPPEAPVDLPDLLAHEVRGPLAIAHLRLQTLAGRLVDKGLADEAANCQSAIAGLETVGRLLDTYLTASRPWKAGPVDLGAVCDAAAAAARELDVGGTVLVLRAPPDETCWVHGERQALYQLVWNLIRNGLEAGGPQATVSLEIGAVGRAQRPMVRVSDNGPGFPPAILQAPFRQRRSDKPGGMGIGLVLCHWITERHQGSIALRNGEHGAVVSVQLPRALPPPQP